MRFHRALPRSSCRRCQTSVAIVSDRESRLECIGFSFQCHCTIRRQISSLQTSFHRSTLTMKRLARRQIVLLTTNRNQLESGSNILLRITNIMTYFIQQTILLTVPLNINSPNRQLYLFMFIYKTVEILFKTNQTKQNKTKNLIVGVF